MRQLGDEPLGGGAHAEGDRLDRVEGRLEGHVGVELRRRGAGGEERAVLSPCPSPDLGAVGAQPVLDGLARQVGQVAQRAEAEPLQQADEVPPRRPSSCSTCTGRPRRNAAEPPSGTTDHDWTSAVRAACSAVKRSSAMPTRTSQMPPSTRAWQAVAAAAVSVPYQLPGARTASRPGRSAATPGRRSSTRARTGSKARASRSGLAGSSTSSGHRAWASRRRCPRRTPSPRAGPLHTSTTFA